MHEADRDDTFQPEERLQIVDVDASSALLDFPSESDIHRDSGDALPPAPVRRRGTTWDRRAGIAVLAVMAAAFGGGAYVYDRMSEPAVERTVADARGDAPAPAGPTNAPAQPAASGRRAADRAPVQLPPVTTAPVAKAPVAKAPVMKAPVTKAPVTTEPVTTVPAVAAARRDDERDLSGTWTLDTHVESSALERYEGLQLGYRVTLQQEGSRVTGRGFKIRENASTIRRGSRTPIEITGHLAGDRLTLDFREVGRLRASSGTMVVTHASDRTWNGRFTSDAARSAGGVVFHR